MLLNRRSDQRNVLSKTRTDNSNENPDQQNNSMCQNLHKQKLRKNEVPQKTLNNNFKLNHVENTTKLNWMQFNNNMRFNKQAMYETKSRIWINNIANYNQLS